MTTETLGIIDDWQPAVRPPKNRYYGIEIESGKCNGCGECVWSCPIDSIVIQDAKAAVGYSCAGCGSCLDACPRGAISLPPPKNRYYGIEIESDKCNGCGECVLACPLDSIVLAGEKAFIDDSCGGCGVCIEACPTQALVRC